MILLPWVEPNIRGLWQYFTRGLAVKSQQETKRIDWEHVSLVGQKKNTEKKYTEYCKRYQ